jgi:cation diffusion facilitator CzcD-associated flavoprotein CzcO
MLDWLIVGGGPHGLYIAQTLRQAAPAAEVAVMDPQAALAAWRRRAQACGMAYLRSSGAHHLGQCSGALRAFAALHGYDERHWRGYYRRPSRVLFEAHARAALAGPPLIAASAAAIIRNRVGWIVETQDGQRHRARRTVLALGPNAPYRPAWGADAEHVYDPHFGPAAGTRHERVLVVGGGISGAQLALKLAAAGCTVGWIARTALRIADFDSDPCYAGRRCLEPFAQAPIAARATLLAAARRPGTLTPDVHARVAAALYCGEITWHQGAIRTLDDAGVVLTDGARVPADRVVLATGFTARPASGGLLTRTLAAAGVRLDAAGHAGVAADLSAAPGLHLTGRPASLQLGPMAGNIRGARLAGQKLAAVARALDRRDHIASA